MTSASGFGRFVFRLGFPMKLNEYPLRSAPNSQESGSPSAGCTLVAPERSLWIQAESLLTDYRSCAIPAKVSKAHGHLPIHVYKT